MLNRWLLAFAILCFSSYAFAQAPAPAQINLDQRVPDLLTTMAGELTRVSRSVEKLHGNWKSFFDQFSSNQGLQLTEKQQKILMTFEILNRSEQRLSNLQKMRLESIEKQTAFRLQLARITDDLRPESIDRYVASRGTLDAEQVREIRRQALNRERIDLTAITSQLQRDLEALEIEIRETTKLISGLRARLFSNIQLELNDF